MKKLVKTQPNISWAPHPNEGRLYLTDELPERGSCATAFGFAFSGDKILLTRLRDRDWDIPGGAIERGETPEQAAVREVWEETSARVRVTGLLGIQELELFTAVPKTYRWPHPVSVQVYYLCELIELEDFNVNAESTERRFFAPKKARSFPTMQNHLQIYEEALRRAGNQ